jgi:multiple RNA-binding domain-containing protein 1
VSEAETKKKKEKLLKKRKASTDLGKTENEDMQSNKLIVKNLAFESTANDIRELFKSYGALKKVRLPKKVNSSSHRGFGFVEFVSSEEAKNAFTHL